MLKSALRRAKRGLRDDARMHVAAIASLTVTFLCLGAVLIGLTNLSHIADRWGGSVRLSVYLRDGSAAADVLQLRAALERLADVQEVTYVTAAQARRGFFDRSDLGAKLETLPTEAFPASLELAFADGTPSARAQQIADRVRQFRIVEEVEGYRRWFDQLENLLVASRGAAAALTLLVILCVIGVVGSTIRLAVASRGREIEVMKLCGATDRFVRAPFVLEGVVQGFSAAFAALLLLLVGFVLIQRNIDSTVLALTGVRAEFLPPLVVLGLLAFGALLGGLGSALSVRRYLAT